MRVREDERPDNWICQTIFENCSSFAVDLVKLQVRMKGSDDLLFDVSDVKEDVHPQGKWKVKSEPLWLLPNLISHTISHTRTTKSNPQDRRNTQT